MELAYDLENGLAMGGQSPQRKLSLYERDPLMFWKCMAVGLFVALLADLLLLHLH
jgi:hypothetical protein